MNFPKHPQQICFWTGAGVSADPPTALPLGDALTRDVIRTLCGTAVRDAVEDEFRTATMQDTTGRRKTLPRLEWVLEHAYRIVGDRALRPLDVLATAAFNDLHLAFAEHLAKGGAHITVNVDSCVENAAAARGVQIREPLHLHGSIGAVARPELLVRSGQLELGLTEVHKRAIRSALANVQLLAFVGYSGRDYFDVEPFLLEWALERSGLEHLTVVWVRHADRGLASREWRHARALDGTRMLDALHALGANCHYVEGSTREFVRRLAYAAGLSAPARRSPIRSPTPPPRPEAPESVERWILEGHLWWSMGHGGRIVDLDRRLPRSPDPRGLAETLLEVRWVGYRNVGLYDESLALLGSVPSRGRRLSMRASDLELRGNRWRAGLLHARAALASPVIDDGTDAYHHAVDAQLGYVHWWARERTTIGGWPLLGLALICIRVLTRVLPHPTISALDPVAAFERFATAQRYFDGHPHAVNQLADIRVSWSRARRQPLPEHVRRRHAPGRDIFVETDHFLGYVNTERGELRARFAAGDLSAAEVERHRERAAQICDLPGILKAALLQRPLTHVLSVPEELSTVQWAIGRRWRWKVKWALLAFAPGQRSRVARRLAASLVRL